MSHKSAIRKRYIDKYRSIPVPTEVTENACESPQNQGFLNELHGESVKHGLGAIESRKTG
jgi:hypothetical protein